MTQKQLLKERTHRNTFRKYNLGVLMIALGLLCLSPVAMYAQRGGDAPVILDHADEIIHDQFEMPDAQRLKGHISFRHAGMHMVCDSAVYYQSSKSFEAFGRVRITQGDTLSITGERLFYDGLSETAYMRSRKGEVEVRHRQQKLFSDSLFYNAREKTITYDTGGKLIDGKNVLTSNFGEYHTDSRQAIFRYQVHLNNGKDELVSDEFHYNTRTKEAKVVGKSNIYSGDYNIFTTSGDYNTNSEIVELHERSILNNPTRQVRMEADRVYYDKQSGMMRAYGNVYCIDRKNKAILEGDHCEMYEDKEARTDSSFVTGHALVRDYSNGKDTLYVHGDTLRLFSYNTHTDSLQRTLKGYNHVRAFRTDVQAVCDSLVYKTQDNCLWMFRDPIVWTDERQVLGEEIQAFLNDSTVDSIYVIDQALLVERMDSLHYNQVASHTMRAYFQPNGDLSVAAFDGNVCTIMYPLESDSTILYHNYAEAPKVRMTMENNKLKRIVAFPKPEATLYPLGTAPPERTFLPSFAWFDKIRPVDKDDVFVWKPKHEDKRLRTQQRRQAPLQTL